MSMFRVWAPVGLRALAWLALTVSLASLANSVFAPVDRPKWWTNNTYKVRSFLQRQLPPTRLWLAVSDGLTILDVILCMGLLALHAKYFLPPMISQHARIVKLRESGQVFRDPLWYMYFKVAGRQFGVLMFIDVYLLLLPIPRSSFLQDLAGLDHAAMIRYHKFLGLVTFYMLTLHALVTYAYWGFVGRFWREFWDWGTIRTINNLAGTLSWLCFILLAWASKDFIRRSSYQFFYRIHILGFLGFMVLGCIHYSGAWRFFTPGLLLWGVDLVQRAGMGMTPVPVLSADVDSEKDVTTLVLQHSQSTCPLGDIHLLVPAISRWAWHPFTIARATPAAGLTPGALTLHVKGEGQWTRALRRLAAAGAGRRLEVRASLPARSLPAPEPWAAAEAVAVVVGGIAATAAMPALRSLVEARRSGHQGPRRVLVLWAARHATEFLALDPVVGAAALAGDGWLTLELHLTRRPGCRHCGADPQGVRRSPSAGSSQDEELVALQAGQDPDPDPEPGPEPARGRGRGQSGEAAAGYRAVRKPQTGLVAVSASPLGTRNPCPLPPAHQGRLHLMALHLITFLGGFTGLILGWSWMAEAQTARESGALPRSHVTQLYGTVGATAIACFCVVGLGLPFAVLIAPPMLVRLWQGGAWRRITPPDADPGEEEARDLARVPVLAGGYNSSEGCSVDMGTLTVPGHGSIPILPRRPAMDEAFAELGLLHSRIDVLLAGPEGMYRAGVKAVAALNGHRVLPSSKPMYEVHKLAGML
ncbi:FRE1B [Auxenochlorella protothecoides x Auxenochlorella symbiontica]